MKREVGTTTNKKEAERWVILQMMQWAEGFKNI